MRWAAVKAPTTTAMTKSDLHGNESLDFRDLFSSASPPEIEAACLYEHMSESQSLRDCVSGERKSDQRLPTPFLTNFSLPRFGYLIRALQSGGFPKPWKQLSKRFRTRLVALLATGGKRHGNTNLYPPVMIAPGQPEFDYSEDCWRVGQAEPFELSLFKSWKRSGRKCFFGFIRIDTDYNETEAVEAFRTEFRKRWPKTKGGGSPKWGDRLKQLAVMRIWKCERNQWKRLKLVAEFCGYKGCIREAAAYKKRCKEGRGDEPMSQAAKVEMSSARGEARNFFRGLFPGEEPLSY
jgi:hypothetical protein